MKQNLISSTTFTVDTKKLFKVRPVPPETNADGRADETVLLFIIFFT
jgi:hypothetical protein